MTEPMFQLFVVERFDDSGGTYRLPPLPASLPGVNVVFAVQVPADDVVLAFVEAADEATVQRSLADAGWPVDRITIATPSWCGVEGES